MTRRTTRQSTFSFAHPVEQLWAIVSDGPRLNELVGVPKYDAFEVPGPDGRVDVFGRLRFGRWTLEWRELPVNWIENGWLEQTRRFAGGPIEELGARVELVDEGPRSRLDCVLTATPRNLLGRVLARKLAMTFEDGMRRLLPEVERSLRDGAPDLAVKPRRIPSSARARARELAAQVEATRHGHGLAGRLADHLLTGLEVDLNTIRPLALAQRWRVPARHAVELALESVRAGLLESRWDLLCPRCRVSKEVVDTLGALPDGVHCAACNIDFGVDFARNVELAFSPGRAVRPIELGHFCRSTPSVTPHIKGQITLAPGEHRSLAARLAPGDYRLRTLEAGGELDVIVSGEGGFPIVEVCGESVRSPGPATPGEISLVNAGAVERTLVIEDRTWRRDVLTAEKVTTLQAFRDLFSEQVLRPGDDVAISRVTFMFTDLAGSTALFARVGDAGAYRIVREHFGVLGPLVREHDGTIVKTTGDGVHAAFGAPDDALRAAIAMQRAVSELNRAAGREELSIRVGLHTGSSISVTFNERLDYYGSSVNLAARLEGEAGGGGIAMSQTFVEDVAVGPMLAPFEIERFEARLKGFEEPVPVHRFRP